MCGNPEDMAFTSNHTTQEQYHALIKGVEWWARLANTENTKEIDRKMKGRKEERLKRYRERCGREREREE